MGADSPAYLCPKEASIRRKHSVWQRSTIQSVNGHFPRMKDGHMHTNQNNLKRGTCQESTIIKWETTKKERS